MALLLILKYTWQEVCRQIFFVYRKNSFIIIIEQLSLFQTGRHFRPERNLKKISLKLEDILGRKGSDFYFPVIYNIQSKNVLT